MTEPDVTLTDYALAVECALFCALATRWPTGDPRLRRSWAILFGSICVGSSLGGTVHGFFAAANTPGYLLLWAGTLLCLGVTSTAMWMIGSYVVLDEGKGSVVRRAAIVVLVVYSTVVLFVSQRFVVAIAAYLPATVFLLVAFVIAYRRSTDRPLLVGIIGLALTFVAAAVQQLRIAIHPVYFNHNALYHVIQGVALWLLFLGAREITQRASSPAEIVRTG